MNVNDVKHHIISGEFDNFYIFDVEDSYIAKLYIDKIVKRTGYRLEYVESVSEIYSKLRSKSLFSSPFVYVVMNDKEFTNSKYESRWDLIESQIKSDILILEYTSVDRRIKFWKKFKDHAVKFEHLDDRLLVKHIQSKIKLSEKDCKLLIDVCESDYGRILNEIDKMLHMSNKDRVNVRKLVDAGVIYSPPYDAIFDFVEAMLDRDAPLSFRLLQDCYAIGEPNMRLLTVLYNSFRDLLQVQTCTSNNIAKSTGLTGWRIKKVSPFVDIYSDDELLLALSTLHDMEIGIKTGDVSDVYTVVYSMVSILS